MTEENWRIIEWSVMYPSSACAEHTLTEHIEIHYSEMVMYGRDKDWKIKLYKYQDVGAVSYTHLDVYKRQLITNLQYICLFLLKELTYKLHIKTWSNPIQI